LPPEAPLCRNPDHPTGVPRTTMKCSRETEQLLVFYCTACAEIKKIQSVQVKTRAAYKRAVREQLAREGKLMTAPPRIMRRVTMDESLIDKERLGRQ
jgi:hypothetical protein